MNNSKITLRAVALAGGLALLAGSSAFAQDHMQKPRDDRSYNENTGGRIVDGTVQSVEHTRDGDRVRMTDGTTVVVPSSITGTSQGRRWNASSLQPGDVIRMRLYDRNGDGRGAEVQSMELMQSNSFYNNDRRMDGVVMSTNRRAHTLVLRTDDGRSVNIHARGLSVANFRRGDRVSISGRLDHGVLNADDVRRIDNRR